MSRRVRSLVAVLAVLAVLVSGTAPALASGSADPSTDLSGTDLFASNQTPTGGSGPNATPTNGTSTPTPSPQEGSSGTGENNEVSVRVIPVHFDAEYLSAQRTDRGINTTGPFVELELGRPAEQVSIAQPGAEATLLADGRLVRVTYKRGGTPGEASLYTLRLYFPDGTQTIDLYARETDVTIGTSEISNYEEQIERLLDNAADEGFAQSPQGVSNYIDYLEKRSELFEHFFAKKATQAVILLWSWLTNPIGLLLTLLGCAGVATWLYRNHGRVLDIISSDPGKSQRRRERIQLERDEQIASAADEHLADLDEIGTMGEVYWSDTYGVATVYELAELFRAGLPVETADGEIRQVGGVDGLSASSLQSSWLEAVVREGRLASHEIALSHGAAATHRMMSKYGMSRAYRETYEAIRDLQTDLDEQHGVGPGSAFDLGDGRPAGGD